MSGPDVLKSAAAVWICICRAAGVHLQTWQTDQMFLTLCLFEKERFVELLTSNLDSDLLLLMDSCP